MSLLALLLSVACVSTRTETAELILTNGRVFTGTDAQPWAEAVAIRGERIVRVGSATDIAALAGPSTRIVDLRGRLVIPGINDAHVHAPWPSEKTTDAQVAREGVTKDLLLDAMDS